MRFALLTSLFRQQWHWVAVSSVVLGGTALLWLPGVAQIPAIVPADDAPGVMKADAGVLGVPATVAPSPLRNKPASQQTMTIEYEGGPATDLLKIIAGQGEVGITIGSDVEPTLKVTYIKLIDVTPEQAIRKVALAASLRWKKLDDNSYFIGKVLPADLDDRQPVTPRTPVRWTGPIVTQAHDTFNGEPLQANDGSGALPALGSPFPQLANMNNRRQERQERDVRPIRTRYVRPGILAWWVDPSHQPIPAEIYFTNKGMQRAQRFNDHPLSSAVDPNELAQLKSGSSSLPFAQPYMPHAYNNPYSTPYGNANYGAWQKPEYRTNYGFGGGGGGFGGGGGGFGGGGGGIGGGGNNQQGGVGGLGGGGVLELPEGVDQLVAIDAQNVLLVYGTAEGVARLQTIIEYLDRPIRQVEIQAQFIQIAVTDARGGGISFFNGRRADAANADSGDDDDDSGTNNNAPTGIGGSVPGGSQITISKGRFRAIISFLSSKGRARLINSPRVTTMNNLSANLFSTESRPIVLQSTDTNLGGNQSESQNAFYLTTSIGIVVTPTINNDDTITVFLTPQVTQVVPLPNTGSAGIGGGSGDDDDDDASSSTPQLPSFTSQFLTTVANVKDNDVIVLGGLRTRTENIAKSRIPILSRLPLIGKLFETINKTDTDSELVIFLTAHILRRTNDVTPLEGP